MENPTSSVGFVHIPGPYLWHAILAFIADLGWGIRQDRTQQLLLDADELLENNAALAEVPYQPPLLAPVSLNLPRYMLVNLNQ